jgi:hypothetical protein
MADHTVEVRQVEDDPTDDMIVVEAICCGDAKTASRHTIQAIDGRDEASISVEIESFREKVAKRHEAKLRAKDFVKDKVVKTKSLTIDTDGTVKHNP